ncbi:glycosyltransferase family 2 protein [Cupriavidus cauae]|uniref:glycosyltransferase family 2 protein n=1 Tax=Cupriavidus cauae TaxID=2608999 RepID=UPI0022442E8B|nr:glycosyltransferase family 2 protein [Cupriavidus cauae]UZN50271.1 glycosyltransferase family 2 protein [Cupriavidus cauae]
MNSRMTCGVAMCTYNAGVYLSAQLDSITRQTQMPDQVVVCDDGSTDGTWCALNQWAKQARSIYGIDVILRRNAESLGVARNFEQAVMLLRTDLIFLADQDDVWHDDKIEVLAACLATNRDTMLAHADVRLVDGNGAPLGRTMFEAMRLSRSELELLRGDKMFEVLCRRNVVTGMSSAFRRELLSIALPFPEDWLHDEWIGVCAAAFAKIATLPRLLADYRQHDRNVIGVPPTEFLRYVRGIKKLIRTDRHLYLATRLRRLRALRGRLMKYGVIAPDKLYLVDGAIEHLQRRIRFPRNSMARALAVMAEHRTGGYQRFSSGIAESVRDLFRP